MIKFLKKVLLGFIPLVSAVCCVFADIPDSFSITIKDSFNVGEAVDFTVTAIKDGDHLKEYSGTVYFNIFDKNGNIIDSDFYTLPHYGYYDFVDTDQGTKTFSKGLEIRKGGTYTIEARDLFNDNVKGKIVVSVAGGGGGDGLEAINITYPTNGSIETKSYVTVIGACENLKNSPVVVYLNDKAVGSGYTDGQGTFEIHTAELLSGDNEIQAKIIDINGVILGESAVISVKYQAPVFDNFSLEILPSKTGKQGDKIIFNLSTSDTTSIAQLIFSNGLKFSMDRIGQGLFSKELVANFSGDIDISISLTDSSINNSNEKIYENVDRISIAEVIGVSNIQFIATGVDGTRVIVSWDILGDVSKFQINYGTSKDDLSTSEIVNSSTILIENLEKDTTYYFQIVPMDSESHKSGDPSDIVEYHPASLSCVVKGIKVKKEQIGDNYYLVWDNVENAIYYEVYRSDWADMTDSRLVGSLTGTRFQYLFNPDAEKDEYAYYQVQAICPDGKTVIVDKAQKVKVGPVENILLVLVISIFVYSLYRLNKIGDEN